MNNKRVGIKKAAWCLMAFLLSISGVFAQLGFNKTEHDFGEINEGDQRYTDFVVGNIGSQDVYILRVVQDQEISAKLSNKTIKEDSSAIIRIQYNPIKKGPFKKEVQVYISTSLDPVILTLKGKSNFAMQSFSGRVSPSKTSAAYLTECPDFGVKKTVQHPFYATVVSAVTKKPIKDAEINVIQNGISQHLLQTDQNGRAEKVLPIGIYYFVVKAAGYATKERDKYINRNNDSLYVELDPLSTEELAVVELKAKEEVLERKQLNENPMEISEVKPNKNIQEEDENPEFSLEEFSENNIIFLVDVSSSMARYGRMDLLKASLLELVKLFRSVDRIAIITFSSGTTLALSSTPANQKALINQVIQGLQAGGRTEGEKGLDKAYEIANHHFIAGGNNQIFIATDGIFRINGDKTHQMIKDNAEKGLNLSALGIKNDSDTQESMNNIASLGSGDYISIQSFEEAQAKLVETIKKNAKK